MEGYTYQPVGFANDLRFDANDFVPGEQVGVAMKIDDVFISSGL
jgi:hypothetical protein